MQSTKFKMAVASLAALSVSALAIPGATATHAPAAGASSGGAVVQVSASDRAGMMTSRVIGHFGQDGTVRGRFIPDRFVLLKKSHKVMAYGTLKTTLRRGDGTLVGRATKQVSLPLKPGRTQASKATCNVLHLVLGPLDLNLLGLKVHLDRVVLDITAQSGPGNLLGNLLCAVAGLLDGTPTLSDLLNVANILNRILNILG